MSERTWEYDAYDPAAERLRESLCRLGNGYFATRGAVPECRAGLVHYPATYAGVQPPGVDHAHLVTDFGGSDSGRTQKPQCAGSRSCRTTTTGQTACWAQR